MCKNRSQQPLAIRHHAGGSDKMHCPTPVLVQGQMLEGRPTCGPGGHGPGQGPAWSRDREGQAAHVNQ